jgi:hypothetical protein
MSFNLRDRLIYKKSNLFDYDINIISRTENKIPATFKSGCILLQTKNEYYIIKENKIEKYNIIDVINGTSQHKWIKISIHDQEHKKYITDLINKISKEMIDEIIKLCNLPQNKKI